MRALPLFAMMAFSVPVIAQDAGLNQLIQLQQQQVAQQMVLNGQQSGDYVCNPNRIDVPKPIFSLKPGSYNTPQRIRLIDWDRLAVIHFTTDGATPTISSPTFTRHHRPLLISSTTHIQAVAVSCDGHSLMADAVFTLPIKPVQAPAPVQVPKLAMPAPSLKPKS